MLFAVVAASSVIAGIIQSVTGFGSAVFLMLVIPHFFNMVAAPALSSAISMGLAVTLAWKFRKHIAWDICLFPTVVYLVFSVAAINCVKGINLDALTLAFGIFLTLLALYFFACSERLSFQANRKTASVCAAVSGVTSGLFGIGGPLMAIYFVSATKEKETYLGSIQFLFAVTNAVNLLTRMVKGIYTLDLLPMTVLGFLGITAGKSVGLRILTKLDPGKTKKLIYAFVGISGVLTILQSL